MNGRLIKNLFEWSYTNHRFFLMKKLKDFNQLFKEFLEPISLLSNIKLNAFISLEVATIQFSEVQWSHCQIILAVYQRICSIPKVISRPENTSSSRDIAT